ncbi:TPA: DMT family transporter [Campylobacter jejuni]|nr:DMT family transporter [Campylobacter jejuni]HDZ5090645.1 DMT family transporter [Campylobacter jejuni]HDZ5092387.1 DMT family transporter [Campylobacter jejuni]HDZ5100481.1 DMT family transporter [Campylobacter jejuni]
MNRLKYLFILLVIAMFLWGSSWPTSKILANYTDTSIITFWRFFFVVIGSFFVLNFLKIPLKLEKTALKWVFIAGVLNGLYAFVFFIAIKHGLAGKGGVLVTTMIPIFSYLIFMIVILFQKDEKSNHKITKSEILGLFLGLVSGLCLLNLGSIEELFGKFNALFLSCAFIWALMAVFTDKAKGTHPLTINFYINLISLLMFSWVLFDLKSYEIFHFDLNFWASLFVVAFLSTVVGTSIYYYGIHILGSIKANSFVLITPASALICSFFILNEVPTVLTLIGCVLAIFAIYFINIYGKKNPNHSI